VLNLSSNINLNRLECQSNNLSSLNLDNCNLLTALVCSNNQITNLNLLNHNSLNSINCSSNLLTQLNIGNVSSLNALYCGNNQISTLNLTQVYNITNLVVSHNAITAIQFHANPASLHILECNDNLISSLNISDFTNLDSLKCENNLISNLNIPNFIHLNILEFSNNPLQTANVSGCVLLTSLDFSNMQLTNINVTGCSSLQNLDVSNNSLVNLDVTGLNNLVYLSCKDNQLVNLNVNSLTNLQELYCNNNQLTSLNANGLTNMVVLYCHNNQLISLNINGLTSLEYLYCYDNELPSLDVSSGSNILELYCWSNQITSLNVNSLVNMYELSCEYNQIPSLELNNLPNLGSIYCGNNQFSSLNLANLNTLYHLNTDDSPLLNSIILKNGSNETVLYFDNIFNLEYICTDENHIAQVQDIITQYGYTNCNVNSYCSFLPGGTSYIIQGNNKFDFDNNGCDVSDLVLPSFKFNISNGPISGSLISNLSGSYTIPVQAGTHNITPVLENPTYFTISQTTVNVTFPSQASPFTQNFCVTANGIHPDLEVTLLPLNAARPGFEAKYKVIYKNKGNTTQSGAVNLAFNDAVLDLVVSNPVTTSQSVNNLSWDFTNLLPFESREITLTLNVNSPMETPAVNSGDILNYTTTITSAATDDMPNDNTLASNQTVVNAFDPNDKTCLEGGAISPAKVGDYVHYMIRFENTGTFPAENIVVKDLIDLTKFDISTLVPMKGSHSFVTNITSGNKVEFIFENINLPFDDANNDGYVAFKIKTQPTLVLGNTFSNTASIYFDYNFPIVTNTATTTIAVLATQDFVFSNYFTVYPNPVKDILNIKAKETIEVTSINIYNTLGQLVLVIPNAQNTKIVDVSGLTSGNYFIKINSDKGTANTKFIKN
ncbi:MAG: T9SS type A sorting domain-containing protein, partial [Flavobacterium sp.]